MLVRIVHTVFAYHPSVGGSQLVVQKLSEGLAALGHEVTVACAGSGTEMVNGVEVRRFDVRGNSINGLTGEVDAYRQFVRQTSADVIMMYTAQSWSTDALLPILKELPGRKILCPVGYSRLYDRGAGAYFATLWKRLTAVDCLVCHSEHYRDAYIAQGLGLRVVYIPNGADPVPRRAAAQPPYFICVGNHLWAKGHEFVIRAFRAAGVDGQLIVVGKECMRGCLRLCQLESLRDPRVRLAFPGRSELLEQLIPGAVAVVSGSRLECAPLVQMEAQSAGVPFIARWAGAIQCEPGAIVVANWREMAYWMSHLVTSPGWRGNIGSNGYDHWQRHHRWTDVVKRYEQLYRDVSLPGA